MENATRRAVSVWTWSRVALVAALAAALLGPGAGACPAAFIISTTPLPGGRVLQLPDVAFTRELAVLDANTGVSILVDGGGNGFGAQSATDRFVRVPGSSDLEGFRFRFSNPNVFTGVTVRDVSTGFIDLFNPEFVVGAFDQFGRGTFRSIVFSRVFTVSILATGGSTLSEFQIITPDIGTGLGPIELQAVPEPSPMVLAASGGLAVLGYAWRRRRRGAVLT